MINLHFNWIINRRRVSDWRLTIGKPRWTAMTRTSVLLWETDTCASGWYWFPRGRLRVCVSVWLHVDVIVPVLMSKCVTTFTIILLTKLKCVFVQTSCVRWWFRLIEIFVQKVESSCRRFAHKKEKPFKKTDITCFSPPTLSPRNGIWSEMIWRFVEQWKSNETLEDLESKVEIEITVYLNGFGVERTVPGHCSVFGVDVKSKHKNRMKWIKYITKLLNRLSSPSRRSTWNTNQWD